MTNEVKPKEWYEDKNMIGKPIEEKKIILEQIKNHGEVIKWFCDNLEKGVWARYYLAETDKYTWDLQSHPDWNAEVYVQNDEYVEFRKALADGKTIEYYEKNSYNKWFNITIKNRLQLTDFSINILRIKPEESEFKVGDWVREKSSGFIIQAYENMISKNFELWKPKVGEWCVFWNYEEELKSGVLIVDLLKSKTSMGYVPEKVAEVFENIAPLELIQTIRSN